MRFENIIKVKDYILLTESISIKNVGVKIYTNLVGNIMLAFSP